MSTAGEDRATSDISGEEIQAGPGELDLDVLDVTLSFFIRSLNIAVSRDWESRLDGLDAIRGAGRVTAILLIDNHPGIRPSVIAQAAMKDRSDMGRVLDGLETAGLIVRRTHSRDSRAWALFLTDEGRRVADLIRQRVRESRAFFGDLSEQEYDALICSLRALYWRIVTHPRTPGGAA